MSKKLSTFFLALVIFGVMLPSALFAHEVYVLPQASIDNALFSPSPSPFDALKDNFTLFIKWSIGLGLLFIVALRISLWEKLQRFSNDGLLRMKKYAPLVERVTVGVSLIASAYYFSLFGPELTLDLVSTQYAGVLQIVLYIVGVLVTLGLFTRVAGIAIGIIYIFAFIQDGDYLVSYINYLGAAILLILLGGSIFSIDNHFKKRKYLIAGRNLSAKEMEKREEWAFFLLRLFYGTALIFAALYAKYFHSNLALQTVLDYDLTSVFPFEPLFLVLGAFLTEVSIGLLIILGIGLRLVLVVFTVFLTLSIMFFGEAVWPHLILFGLNITLFLRGYDRFSLLKKFSKDELEPIL